MNQSLLLLAGLMTGALVPLQLVFNGQLGLVTKNAYSAGFIIFLVGALAFAVILLATRPAVPSLTALAAAPKTVWLGGLIAAAYIVAVVTLTPKIGIGATAVLIIAGQLITAVILDHLGAFGMPQVALNWPRLAGVSLIAAGVALVKLS